MHLAQYEIHRILGNHIMFSDLLHLFAWLNFRNHHNFCNAWHDNVKCHAFQRISQPWDLQNYMCSKVRMSGWVSWCSAWLSIGGSWVRTPAVTHVVRSPQQAFNHHLPIMFRIGPRMLEVPCMNFIWDVKDPPLLLL